MGSGGSRGLQNRCFGAEASKGWFDSDTPPPSDGLRPAMTDVAAAAGDRRSRLSGDEMRMWRGSRFAAVLPVVVFGVEFDRSEQFDDLDLLAALDVLLESVNHGRFLRSLAADTTSFFNQFIADAAVRSHSESLAPRWSCRPAGRSSAA